MGPARKSDPVASPAAAAANGPAPEDGPSTHAGPNGSPATVDPHHDPSEPPPISGTMGVRARSTTETPPPVTAIAAPPETPGPPPQPAASTASTITPHPVTLGETPKPPAQPVPTRIGAEALAEIAAQAEPVPDPARRVIARKPLLASEALMEDLAPVEPARRGARAWCLGVGAASLIFGALPLVGLLPGGTQAAIPWLVTGAIALVAGVTLVTYRQRAVAMVVLGLLSGVVALQGAGGLLMRADGGPPWGLARLLAAVTLPAALLFRARYRAYAGARVFLGTALAMCVPFAVHVVLGLFAPAGVATVGAVAVLAVLAGSLTGFMGAETTGAGAYVAPAAVIVLALDLALAGLGFRTAGGSTMVALLGIATGAVAFGGASALASLGLFQILAWRFAADARRIDLHSGRRESRPPESDRGPGSDWSTRD